MQQKEQVIAQLKKSGRRMTKQREILLDIILDGTWNSCKEIYYAAIKRDPSIGLATVYRIVSTLEELGILTRSCLHCPFVDESEGGLESA